MFLKDWITSEWFGWSASVMDDLDDQDLDYLHLNNLDLDYLNLYTESGCWRSWSWGSGSWLSRYKFFQNFQNYSQNLTMLSKNYEKVWMKT